MKTYMNLCVEFDQETFSLEAQFANLRPVEGIYFCVALWNGEGKQLQRLTVLSNGEVKAHIKAVITWKTWSPMWATARLILVPSRSAAGWKRTPYISSLRAISKIWKSDSAGVWPLKNKRINNREQL